MELLAWMMCGFPVAPIVGMSAILVALLAEFAMWQVWTEPLWTPAFFFILAVQGAMLCASWRADGDCVPGPVVVSAFLWIMTMAGHRIVPVDSEDRYTFTLELEQHRNAFSAFSANAWAAGHMFGVGLIVLVLAAAWLWFCRSHHGYHRW